MNKNKKQLQYAEDIRKVISYLLINDNKISKSNLYVTIIDVDISRDLRNAKIFLSILVNKENSNNINNYIDKEEVNNYIEFLNKNQKYIKYNLLQNIKSKYNINLTFLAC